MIAYDAIKASKALSLTKGQFLQLVNDGVLPRPKKLGQFERWDAAELQAIFKGEKINSFEDVQW